MDLIIKIMTILIKYGDLIIGGMLILISIMLNIILVVLVEFKEEIWGTIEFKEG